jgi:hypothetical protein
MMSLCKTLPLFIIKQIYHFSLYLVKYPQTPSDLEEQVTDLTSRINDLEETIYHLSNYLEKNIKKELYNELKPKDEYLDMNTYNRNQLYLNDTLTILQHDIKLLKNRKISD